MAWFRVDVPPSSGGNIPDQIAKIAQGTTFDYSELGTKTGTIPQYVFHGSQIRDVESTDVITVQDRAFEGCTNLRKINLPNCTSIGSYAFSCNRTTYASTISINLPAVTNISAYAFNGFYGTDSTSEITFPACTYVGQYAFQHSSSNTLTIKSLSFPAVTQMGGSSFVRIIAETIDIGENCTSMGSTPLANSTVTNLIIRATTPPTLGTNAGLGNGASITHIYVPAAEVETYKTTNRWSQYASYIKAIPSVTLNANTQTLSVNDTFQLSATTTPSGQTVSYASSDATIASVDSSGLITGAAVGIATITASFTIDGLVCSAVCEVTVE